GARARDGGRYGWRADGAPAPPAARLDPAGTRGQRPGTATARPRYPCRPRGVAGLAVHRGPGARAGPPRWGPGTAATHLGRRLRGGTAAPGRPVHTAATRRVRD